MAESNAVVSFETRPASDELLPTSTEKCDQKTSTQADVQKRENDTVTFSGDILYKPDGTAIIVDSGNDVENQELQNEGENTKQTPAGNIPAPNQTIHFVTILKSTSDSSTASPRSTEGQDYGSTKSPSTKHQPQRGNPTSVQNFVVHNLSEDTSNVNNNNNVNLIFEKLLKAASQSEEEVTISRRPILMCFPCRLAFGISESFLAHSSATHNIEPNEHEKELLGCNNVSSVVQETAGGRAFMCFLEPVEGEFPSSDERHHEKTGLATSDNNSVSVPTENADTQQQENERLRADDVKMEEDRLKEETEQTQIEEKENNETLIIDTNEQDQETNTAQAIPELVSTPNDSSEAKNSAIDLTSVIRGDEPALKLFIQSSHLRDASRTKKSSHKMATTSENPSRASPLTSITKVPTSGKSSDSLFGGSGVATVDPLFQMSLFQSRNSCKTLKCPRCNWHYKYRQTLDAHMKEKHVDETSDCRFCNANQPHPRLSRGESYACGYKPFKCEVCNYSTTTKGNLSIHMQSDKHLYNVKSLQHQQQLNKDKLNSQQQGGGNNEVKTAGSPIPARLLAEKQEQFQNLLQQQARTRSSPDSPSSSNLLRGSPQSRKGDRDFTSSPSSNRRQTWRCDVCSYETDIPRNLRIHMQSEKHAHNVALLGVAGLRRQQESQIPSSNKDQQDENEDREILDKSPPIDTSLSLAHTSLPPRDQNSPSAMAALYYYLATLQSSMQPNQPGDSQQPSAEEREKQQKQFLAQQQQLLLAQQYQQMLAQLSGSGDAPGTSTAMLQQQILLQQQLQMWKQLMQQGDCSQMPNMLAKQGDSDFQDTNNPPSTSNKFLFTCGVCCNFSCNDLESLCAHVRAPRYPRSAVEESEWVTKCPGDGYLCRICNYSTQLKTNFSLHCKTEKHTSKLQLINHIREGGDGNEWKVSYAIAGNNMNKVTCNGCRHSATSVDKLRIHCSTDRHQGTLTMCHYLDKVLKDSELKQGLKTSDGISTHHLLCRPCSYQSKFVVEMIQHMQCQNHQAKVHREHQKGNVTPTDIVAAEPDKDDESMDEDPPKSTEENQDVQGATDEDNDAVSGDNATVDQTEIYRCRFCNYDTREKGKLELHNATQHGAQVAIKCPICPEYLDDTMKFQMHLIQVHQLLGQAMPEGQIAGTLEAIQFPFNEDDSQETMSSIHGTNSKQQQNEHCMDDKMEVDDDSVNNAESSSADLSVIFSNPRLLLSKLCSDAAFARKATKDPCFGHAWDAILPPFSCCACGETFVKKTDLFDHLLMSPAHKIGDVTQNNEGAENHEAHTDEATPDAGNEESHDQTMLSLSGATSKETEPHVDGKCVDDKKEREENQGKIGPTSSKFDFSLLSEYKSKRGRLLYPGISKSTHKRVLEDVGFDQVAHFVENRMPENRERAKQWKMNHPTKSKDSSTSNEENEGQTDGNNNEISAKALHEANTAGKGENNTAENEQQSPAPAGNSLDQNTTSPSQLTCTRCGKEFSNMWILKVHENKVHGLDMSPGMLEEFVHGYTKWYWDSFKQEKEEVKLDDNQKSASSQARDSEESRHEEPPRESTARNSPADRITDANEDNGFKQAALQALMKNYPGIMSTYSGQQQQQQVPPPQPTSVDQSKQLQQHQILLQMLMATQAQLQQQQQSSQPQGPNQANASNIMNMLIDHLYGAAMHGATPGFMDPMAVMALLQQQQQQSRVPPTGGMNPYQLLAARYLQQQQMQQLLMYPAMAAGAAGMPFMPPSLAENSNQQQMLASFAASLLAPGITQDAGNSMLGNPISNALHAYQLQAAAAAASLSDNRSGGKDPKQDPTKILRMQQQQRDSSASAINQSQQSTEIPAKRPRTRITDDQLKILRANFDINTSPSEDQISEMAIKTSLPPKVIKHWFRNTLFKERQRSKDSPYNFNIPPITSLDDIKDDYARPSDVNKEDSVVNTEEDDAPRPQQFSGSTSSDLQRRISEHETSKQNDLHGASGASRLPSPPQIPESTAMQIFSQLSDSSNNSNDAQHSFFANLLPGLHRGAEKSNTVTLVHATDLSRRTSSENDANQLIRRDTRGDAPPYTFNRPSQGSNNDYFYSSPSQGSMSTITRRTPRTRFSDYQLTVLQEFFDKNAYPKDEDLDKLSRMLELSTRVIVVWFQNARQKARKSYEIRQGAMNATSHHPNGLPAIAYQRIKQSPPSSPPRSSSSSSPSNNSFVPSRAPESHSSRSFGQFSSDNVPHSSSSGFPISVKREPKLPDSNDATSYNCRQCEAILPTLDALQQHERLHSTVIQKYKMHYPSIIEGMMQRSSRDSQDDRDKDSGRSSSKSPEIGDRKSPQENNTGMMTSPTSSQSNHTIGDIMSSFGLSRVKSESLGTSMKSEHGIQGMGMNSSTILSSQFASQGDSMYGTKRSLSVSPTQPMGSMTSLNGTRVGVAKMARKGINDTSKDPKRLRTTITPEQLEFLYKQYLVDSSPSRKVIEQISEIVGLKKRVVQVWFQNTRARERKGQFRSVGRITLGMPQICPHCRVTFRTKADLDAHVRYRHMQSPSSIALSSISQPQSVASEPMHSNRSLGSSESSYSALQASSSDGVSRSPPKDSKIDYREIFSSFNRQIKEKYLGQSEAAGAGDGDNDHTRSPKRRKISDGDSDHVMPFVTSPNSSQPATTLSSKTAEIYKAVTEQIFGSKASSSVDAIAQRLQGKATSTGRPESPQHHTPVSMMQGGYPALMTSSASENRGSYPPTTSSPDSVSSSTSQSFMVPLKRYRTQMTSLQVRSLKHCFAEYKTPTLLECEILGAQVDLPKRVIQVWFQNARAKEKKSRQDDSHDRLMESPTKSRSHCAHCPEMRFGSQQEYRNHIFSKAHLHNFMNTCDSGDFSDEQSLRSPSSDGGEFPSKDESVTSGQQRNDSPSPTSSQEGAESKFQSSSYDTNGVNPEHQPRTTQPGWNATAYASLLASQKYQELAAMHKLMNAGSTQNGSDSQTRDSEDHGVDFSAPKQSWIQQALLRGGGMSTE